MYERQIQKVGERTNDFGRFLIVRWRGRGIDPNKKGEPLHYLGRGKSRGNPVIFAFRGVIYQRAKRYEMANHPRTGSFSGLCWGDGRGCMALKPYTKGIEPRVEVKYVQVPTA